MKARARWGGGQVDPAGTYGRVKELFCHLGTLQPHTLTLQIVNAILYFYVEQRFRPDNPITRAVWECAYNPEEMSFLSIAFELGFILNVDMYMFGLAFCNFVNMRAGKWQK